MSSDIQNTVKTRRVFYIPGYDPLYPRRYRELYRTEGAAQAAISDYQLMLSPKQGAATMAGRSTASLMAVGPCRR